MPDKIGKYEILEKIGTGGFGVVFKGRDPHIKRIVAVKTCEVDDEEVKGRFFREAELAGNLHHPNITVIYDFGIENDTPYLVQEFLTGEDLDKLIKRGERLTLRRKLQILLEVAKGLGHAHECGVIHRDVKPSNIRITDAGETKIMDFGIAKSSRMASKLTQTGITLGTAAYLAPEQIQGSSVDPRTDIFSFGVMMYELFTGIKPFTGDNISQVIYQIIHTDPVLPTRVLPDLPKDLETIILRCLKKRAQERYLSMFEIVREIEKVLLQFTSLNIDDLVIETTSHRPTRPISASFEDLRPTLETPARGIQRGRPWAKIGAAIAGVLIIALLVVTYAITFGSHRNSEPSRPEISVLNPLSMETKEDTLAGVPERAPLPEETPPPQTQKDPPPPPPTKPVPEAGTLVVTSNRESTIMINGKKRGSFPPRMELSLPAGTYALEWVSEEGSYRETVTLEGGKVKLAHHSFPVLSYGRLTVRTPIGSPWGILYVDGEEIGPTPQNGIKLQAGTHRLEVRRDGYKTQIRDVDILEGKILDWPVTLYPVE